MSETVGYEGIIREVDIQGKTTEEFILDFLERTGIELNEYDEPREVMLDNYSEMFFLDYRTYILYEFEKLEKYDYEDYVRITPYEDGSVHFTASFYNGGASLPEVLSNGLVGL